MINVQNITAKLASLPDQALQQYAAMNRNDPYIMSLAVSESNRRKQTRAAQQGQGMQEPPKVVDQAVAQMAPPLPEDTGIAQLPAGEMEFAGGGILAFAQGDSIPGAKSPFERRVEEFKKSQVGQGLKRAGLMPDVDDEVRAKKLRQALVEKYGASAGVPGAFKPQSDEERKQATAILNNLDNMSVAEMEQALSGAAPSSAPRQDPLRAQEAQAGIPDGSVVPPVMSGTPDMPSAADNAAVDAVPAVPAAPTGLARIAPPTAAVAAPVSMDYAGAAKSIKDADLFKKATAEDYAEETAAQEGVAQKRIDAAKAGKTREQEFQTQLGEYGVGKEKRLKEREEKLSKDEKANYGMAFLEAGLAMMGGKDPNAFANISAGALQGLGSYKTGLAKLNDRKEKLFDAYDALEDARRSDKKDRFARIEAAENKIDEATIALKQVGADMVSKRADFNRSETREFGKAVVDAANTQYTARSQAAEGAANRATQASIAGSQQATQRAIAEMPSAEQRMYAALGGGDLEAGMRKAAEIKAGKFDVRTAFSEYLKSFAGKTTLEKPMSFAEFASMFATSSAPSTGPVRELK